MSFEAARETALREKLAELERKDAAQHVRAYDVRFAEEAATIRRQLTELNHRPPQPPKVPSPEAPTVTPRTDAEADAEAVVRGVLPPLLELVNDKAAATHTLVERALALIERQASEIERLEANAAASDARYAAVEQRLAEATRAAEDAAQRAAEALERLDAETVARVALQADMTALRERSVAVEARTMNWAPTFVRDGFGHLICSMPDGTSRDLGQVDGERGPPGVDGVGFDAIDAAIANERTICLTIGSADGLRQKEIQFPLPIAIFRGLYKDNTPYDPGDLVHFAGNLWHCDARTGEAPAERSKVWSIAARRGRDGREGPAGPQGPEGKRGAQGERGPVAYTQVG